MSLDYNFTKIKDRDLSDAGRACLDSLVWATMFLGMDEITDRNKDEFYIRLRIHERMFGPLRRKEEEEIFSTYEEVCRNVGLSTNASTFTNLQFNTRVMKRLREECALQGRKP